MPRSDPRIPASLLSPLVWSSLCWGSRWVQAAHHDLMEAEILDALYVGYDLLFEAPPRHSKSETFSRALPGWFMGRYPDKAVMHASYAVRLGARFGGRIRNDLSVHGPACFGVTISKETRSKSVFELADAASGRPRDGRFFACGVEGGVHGEGADLLVTDDLVKGAEAVRSDVQLDALKEFCLVDLETRRNPGARHVGIMTRWSEADPHGMWLEAFPDRYRIVKLPALAEDDDPLGRERGAALWPERFPVSRLEEIRRGMPAYHWNALYQQRPSPIEGAIFRRAWWDDCRYGVTANGYDCGGRVVGHGAAHVYATVDLAFSEKRSADWTVICVFALDDQDPARALLLDVRRMRVRLPDLIGAVRDVMRDWDVSVVYVERAGQQVGTIDLLVREGFPIKTWGRSETDDLRVSGDKQALWHDATPFVRNGRLWVPKRADWLADWEREMLVAPNGAFDDQVDATSAGVLIADRIGSVGPASLGLEPEPDRFSGMLPSSGRDRWDGFR